MRVRLSLKDWAKRGKIRSVRGQQLHVIDEGEGPDCLLILHGFPSSSFDFHRVLPELSRHYRVIIHDHPGFGLSSKNTNYDYSLFSQTDVALDLWQQLGIRRGHVLAHDYGTSIATELLARIEQEQTEFRMESLTLCNGSLHIEMARLRPIQLLLKNPLLGPLVARLSNRRIFYRNMRQIWGSVDSPREKDLDLMWQLLIWGHGRRVLPKISRYINERHRHWDRWIGALRKTRVPIRVLWGTLDPVAIVEMAGVIHRETHKSRIHLLDGLGHYPMLEDPEAFANAFVALNT